jgi:hypothetical protein
MQEVADLVFERNGGGPENTITSGDFFKFFDPDGSPQEMMRLGTKISDALINAGFRKHSQKVAEEDRLLQAHRQAEAGVQPQRHGANRVHPRTEGDVAETSCASVSNMVHY